MSSPDVELGTTLMGKQDYYAVLGVAENADPEVVKAAYRALAKKHHPDCPGGSAARFCEITSAWQALSKPDLECASSLTRLKDLCEDLRRARDQAAYDDGTARPHRESMAEGRPLFARVQHGIVGLLIGFGCVALLVTVIVLVVILAPVMNDLLREVAKKPLT
jgi:hypothetical protein